MSRIRWNKERKAKESKQKPGIANQKQKGVVSLIRKYRKAEKNRTCTKQPEQVKIREFTAKKKENSTQNQI